MEVVAKCLGLGEVQSEIGRRRGTAKRDAQ